MPCVEYFILRSLYKAEEKGNVKINPVSGSNKRTRQQSEIDGDDSGEHEESDSSIHTSDMSSDDEEAVEDNNDDRGVDNKEDSERRHYSDSGCDIPNVERTQENKKGK